MQRLDISLQSFSVLLIIQGNSDVSERRISSLADVCSQLGHNSGLEATKLVRVFTLYFCKPGGNFGGSFRKF